MDNVNTQPQNTTRAIQTQSNGNIQPYGEKMLIRTSTDLRNALFALLSNTITIDQIEFSDYIEDSIKINSSEWGTSHSINYKVAEYILALQKDILKLYNVIYGTCFSIKDLDKNKFLIVNLTIEDGCIKLITRISKYIFNFYYDMTPSQKVVSTLAITLAVGLASSPFILKELRESKLLPLDTKKEIEKTASTTREAPKVLINNTGDGTVIYSEGGSLSHEDLKELYPKVKKDKENIPPIDIDDKYIIIRYDFDEQRVYLSHHSCESFWASTELLNGEKREQLKKITTEAIDRGTAITANLHITAKINGKKIENATVLGVNVAPRDSAIPLKTLFETSPFKPSDIPLQQGTLLSYF